MAKISFQLVKPSDKKEIHLIANWYLSEWKIPIEKTVQRLSNFSKQVPFQIIMSVDDEPIATGGLYDHVGLLDHEPKFKAYGPWLALVYTMPEQRGKGYGALLCEKIQEISKQHGLVEIFLFTDTAESLYKRLGWEAFERISLKDRNIVVMKKEL